MEATLRLGDRKPIFSYISRKLMELEKNIEYEKVLITRPNHKFDRFN